MSKTALQEELERIDTLTIFQIVAYFAHLNAQISSHDCTDEERTIGLVLLEQLTERVRSLKSKIEPAFP